MALLQAKGDMQAPFKKRAASIKGRTNRIKQLARVCKRAARLFNTGAHPQGSYGKEAIGVCPSTMQQMRALAANCASSNVAGQCASTVIWIVLGKQNDPAVAYPVDQIKMWYQMGKVVKRYQKPLKW